MQSDHLSVTERWGLLENLCERVFQYIEELGVVSYRESIWYLGGAVRCGSLLGSPRRTRVCRQSVGGSFLRRNERRKSWAHLRGIWQ